MSCYSETKYKACPPSETISRIKEILSHAGIKTAETWTESGVYDISSVRVTIEGTDIGQNGKGTDKNYACASGYAEFMERLMTGLLYQYDKDTLSECMGVPASFPDEKLMTIPEAAKAGGDLLKETFRQIHISDGGIGFLAPSVEDGLEKWGSEFLMIPYENISTGSHEWMPEEIGRAYYFTNGSCAGNSKEEALVQGFSEIVERFATDRIMTKRLTPPVIPDEKLKEIPSLWEVVEKIRRHPGYRLRVIDASCGMGLPVVGTILTDEKSGKFLMRFGSHPRFETALERCLTEMFQGRHISRLEHTPEFDLTRDDEALTIENRFNFAKAACGIFPSEVLGSDPSWTYEGFAEAGESIKEQYEYLLKLFSRLSYTPYVRDCSFLGFNVYHIIVPEMSMVFNFGSQRLREKKLHSGLRNALRNIRKCSLTELDNVLSYVLEKRGWMIENDYGHLAGIPCSPKLNGLPIGADVIAALIFMSMNDFQKAATILKGLVYDKDGNVTFAMPLLQAALLKSKRQGINTKAMDEVYPKGWGRKCEEIINDPLSAMPALTCPDCGSCPHRSECAMPSAAEGFRGFFVSINSR